MEVTVGTRCSATSLRERKVHRDCSSDVRGKSESQEKKWDGVSSFCVLHKIFYTIQKVVFPPKFLWTSWSICCLKPRM